MPLRSIRAVWLLAAAFLAPPAMAQSPVTLRFGSVVSWDANVFRLPDSVTDPQSARGLSGRSDRLTTTSLGLRVAKAYSQQNFVLDVNTSALRYGKFSFLDSENLSYLGEWQWRFSPYVSGTLGASRSETPVAFEGTQSRETNKLVSDARSFALTFAPFAAWQLFARATQSETRYATPIPEQRDTSQSGLEAGLRYVSASQSSISVSHRSLQGTPALEETELSVAWPVTGKSTFSGRLSRMEQRYSAEPAFDFSGTTGMIQHRWTPTGKLSLTLSAQRSLAPFIQGTRSSHVVNNALSATPTWQLSEKVSLSMAVSRVVSDYRGAIGPQVLPARRDTVQSVSVSANWTPWRAASFTATLARDRRESNDPQIPYSTTVAGINAAFSF